MLNVINGFYHPQQGEIWFAGKLRGALKPYEIARQGIARTFQNIALFKGMTTLDNLMSGRIMKMQANLFWQAIWSGRAEREEIAHRERVKRSSTFWKYSRFARFRWGGWRTVCKARRAWPGVGGRIPAIAAG